MGKRSKDLPIAERPTVQLFALCGTAILLCLFADSSPATQLGHTYAPSRVVVGDKLTYTYWLENDGASDESGTLFTNKLPPNTVFVSALVTNGDFWISNNVFSCRPERLPPGTTNVIQLEVTPINVFAATNYACWVSSAGIASEIFSVVPVDGARPGPQLVFGRSYHTSTLLRDGRVLVTGGQTRTSPVDLFVTKAAEVYNPASESFSLVGDMNVPRANHTATMLTNGMVLVAAGTASGTTETAEVFDPASNKFTLATTLLILRGLHTATLLPNGDIILAGGAGTNTVIERLHLDSDKWTTSTAGHLLTSRSRHVADLLPDGKILFAGGTSATNEFAEIFDPESGTSAMIQTSGSQFSAMAAHGGMVLSEGYLPGYVPAADVYDIQPNTITPLTLPLAASIGEKPHSYYLQMQNGTILRTGGGNTAVIMFDLRARTAIAAPALATLRIFHTAVQLADGRILLIGGYINGDGGGYMNSTEFYAFRLDSDLDGMDDEWELANGLDPTRREDAVEDADEDGHSNLQEFLAGTNPHDPLNVLKILAPLIVDNKVLVRFPSVIGKYYQVEKSDGSDPRQWLVIAHNIPGNGGLLQIDDPIEPGAASSVYRVLLLR